ncbi:MAG: hypothetical protein ABFS42_05010 [Candidatus Krumholzibacteriota bacterium]
MKDHLDKYIHDSKVILPDTGEYRRLNRALLKERMNKVAPDRARHHKLLVIALSLVLVMGLSGQVSQLGSDDFDAVPEDLLMITGKTVSTMKNEFRNTRFSVPQDYSQEDLEELNRSIAADDGKLLGVTGISYGGKTKWLKDVQMVVNGKILETGMNLTDRPHERPDNFDDFLLAHNKEIHLLTRSEPFQRETVMTFDGVACRVRIWEFHFPGFGQVTRYVGTPVQE